MRPMIRFRTRRFPENHWRNLSLLAALGACLSACAAVQTPPPTAQVGSYFLGQMRVMATEFCPAGTVEANGQLLPISRNNALFSLVGTQFGGDGRTTFGVPDMTGRALIGSGQGGGQPNYAFGQTGGQANAVISPSHAHDVSIADAFPDTHSPGGAYLPKSGNDLLPLYYIGSDTPDLSLQSGVVTHAGEAFPTPVPLYQPTLTLRYCFVTTGAFPNRSTLDEEANP